MMQQVAAGGWIIFPHHGSPTHTGLQVEMRRIFPFQKLSKMALGTSREDRHTKSSALKSANDVLSWEKRMNGGRTGNGKPFQECRQYR